MNMQFPSPFMRNIRHSFEEKGERFLSDLPALINEASRRWELTDIQPVPNLSYNFVAFAKQGGGDVILKIGVPNPELTSEMHALKLFNGEGACRLLDHDEEMGFLLIERLHSGRMLADVEDDDTRTRIAIEVMQNLIFRRGGITLPLQGDFIKLSDWFAELEKIRPEFNGGTGPFPKVILERVESFLPDLFAGKHQLIHGDFHHFNILSSQRGWLAIDPKGVIGPAGYEIGPLMLNPWDNSMDGDRFKVRAKRRVDILHEQMGWERESILQWSMAHAVLSAWWDYPGGDWDYSLRCAEIFSEIK
ncbi:aminoglycoside phosphotransferase family protein [Chloroflexota bacterium]